MTKTEVNCRACANTTAGSARDIGDTVTAYGKYTVVGYC